MFTVLKPHKYVEEIKKSRFIATAVPIESAGNAQEQIGLISCFEATHNCFAYQVGQEYRFSDDGEPGGTAGRPILGAIQAREMDRVLVVVTRFFGGVKFGAGGLARAYGGAAAKCLNEAPKVELEKKTVVEIKVPFCDIGAVYPLLEQFEARKLEESFTISGAALTLEIKDKSLSDFSQLLKNATKGRMEIRYL